MLSDNLYLENIHEHVHDEDKIVTYKWLSRKFDVPVNAAKQMLYAYVSQQDHSEPPVTIIYLVSGVVTGRGDKQEHQVCLVEEDELEATKQHLDTVWGVHIYSIQKAKLKDSGVLYAADYEISKTYLQEYSKWSVIDCPKPDAPQPPSRGTPGKKPSSPSKKPAMKPPRLSHMKERDDTEEVTGEEDGEEAPPTSPAVKVKTEKKSKATKSKKVNSKQKAPAKGTVASFFSKQVKNGTSKKPTSQPVAEGNEDKQETKKEAKKTKPMQLVSSRKSPKKSPKMSPKKSPKKLPNKSPQKSPKTTKKTESPKKRMFQGLNDSDIEDFSDDEEKEENVVEEPDTSSGRRRKAASKSNKKPATKAGRVKVKESEGRPGDGGRKRKRVQNLSSDEEVPDTAARPAKGGVAAASEGGGRVKRRKRVKKLVSSMHIDEDGSMVTEKSWESASTDASDEEETTPASATRVGGAAWGAETETSPVKPKASPVKGSRGTTKSKQASLMSFFKK